MSTPDQPEGGIRASMYALLRWSERYTKTDMVYLAKSSFWINLNFGFISIFSFLLSIAFANLLTKDAYGTYQYVLSISALLVAFTFSGFNTTITQSVARGYEGELRASIRPQLLWNLLPAAAAVVWSGYYFWLGQSVLGWGVLFVALSLPVLNTYNSYAAYLAGKQDFKTQSLYAIGGNAAYYLCIFIGVFLIPQALPLIAINLIVTAASAAYFYYRTMRTARPRAAIDPDALPYAKHLSVMNTLSTVAGQIDNLLVFHFLGAADLALYSIATLIPERLGSTYKAILSAALPRFAGRAIGQVRENLGYRLALLLAGLLATAGLYALIAPVLFHLIYPKYGGAIIYSQVFSLTLVSYVGSLVISALSAHRKVKELYVLNTAVPVFQIVVQVIGILLWGLWGLVIGKIISAAAVSAAALILLNYSGRSKTA